MGNKTELAATVCATILRLAHELAREWICLQAAVALLTRTALATAAILRAGGAAYSRLIVWRAAQPTSRQELLRDAGSLQIVHSLSGGQRPRTPNSISLFIETLGARQGRRECRFRLFLGASDRGRRRLAIELCANRLRRHRPGVRISRGLAHRLLELRDPAAAWTGLRRSDAEAKGGGNEQGCRRSADCSMTHLRASP